MEFWAHLSLWRIIYNEKKERGLRLFVETTDLHLCVFLPE